jgi:hypothetical protein
MAAKDPKDDKKIMDLSPKDSNKGNLSRCPRKEYL